MHMIRQFLGQHVACMRVCILSIALIGLVTCGKSTADLKGTVYNGNELKNVTVSLADPGDAKKIIATTKTGNEGTYDLKDIPPGTYTMSITVRSSPCPGFSLKDEWTVVGISGTDSNGSAVSAISATRTISLSPGTTTVDFNFNVGGCMLFTD